MKIEFRPDFRIPPSFKALWPRILGAFEGMRFFPDGYGRMRRMVVLVLSLMAIVLLAMFFALGLL